MRCWHQKDLTCRFKMELRCPLNASGCQASLADSHREWRSSRDPIHHGTSMWASPRVASRLQHAPETAIDLPDRNKIVARVFDDVGDFTKKWPIIGLTDTPNKSIDAEQVRKIDDMTTVLFLKTRRARATFIVNE